MKKAVCIYKPEAWLCNMIMPQKSNLVKRKSESPRQKDIRKSAEREERRD